jgi:hypothetical protein
MPHIISLTLKITLKSFCLFLSSFSFNSLRKLYVKKFSITQKSNFSPESKIPSPDNFLLSESSSLMYCIINKVASSSFIKTFLRLENITIDETGFHGQKLELISKVTKIKSTILTMIIRVKIK